MILYFANRNMEVLGHASTKLSKGFVIVEDNKTEDVETGIASFECKVGFDKTNRLELEGMAVAGNYLLRSNGEENEFYTILESETDTKDQTVYIYAEDAGLDLINEIVGEYTTAEEHDIEFYVNKFISDSGFEIGVNEIPDVITKKLSWDGESTVTERIASIATQFGDYEVSYSFEIKGFEVSKKYVNIHEKRGKDIGVQLRLNEDVDRIITTKSIANIATALKCTGGTPENAEKPITLKGYAYDDGDFFVGDDGVLRSRDAVEKWGRFTGKHQYTDYAGHIVKLYSFETTSQQTLCAKAIAELKKLREMEVNFEVDFSTLPGNIKVGDRVNVVDEAGKLYLSTRILVLETSVTDATQTATLGEHIIKKSGIDSKVLELAENFAALANTTGKLQTIASNAAENAQTAKETAEAAATDAAAATEAAQTATEAANSATQAAQAAEQAAVNATNAVDNVKKSVESLDVSVQAAQKAVQAAQQAAETAETKASEAKNAAENAQNDVGTASQAAQDAKNAASTAGSKANAAQSTAELAIEQAADAKSTAQAAKLDADQAEKDVEKFTQNLETHEKTMVADYARKTELTETTAHLQSQILRNAAEINSTVSKLVSIDETVNDAKEKATEAQATAEAAQIEADAAQLAADEARTEADVAQKAADDAQAEADAAAEAANIARNVADQAEADLIAAQKDLATIEARGDATQEEIEAAQAAVETALSAALEATTQAESAVEGANAAQETANAAAAKANAAQMNADRAKADADLALQFANAAVEDATTAQANADEIEAYAEQAKATASEAQTNAESAQAIADEAAENAKVAQNTANDAVTIATEAEKKANEATSKAAQAAADLVNAQARFEDVLADVNATQADVEAAQADVETAQLAANNAESEAETTQMAATEAAALAETAQIAATQAQEEANEAQNAAKEAQDAADEAQAAVDGLIVRMQKAETNIIQNAKEIVLRVSEAQEQLDMITKYFAFNINGLTIGQIDNPNKVNIDNDEITILVNDEPVQTFNAQGQALIPMLKITKQVNLFGYLIEQDENGNVNCNYAGEDV